ncbi:MAG: glycosyltransferase 87 family protein [Thermoplasmatota archaeon]
MDIAERRLIKTAGTGRNRLSSEALFFVSLTIYMLSYVFMAAGGDSWLRFQSANAVWYISFAAAVFFFARSSYPGKLMSLGPLRSSLLLFGIALFLQLTFLLREPALSQDIMWLHMRGENMIDGKFPYQDFPVNKPPLYIWMVGLISVVFGPTEASFRIIFVLVNSAIPVVMLGIYRAGMDSGYLNRVTDGSSDGGLPPIGWGIGALAYSLWPVGILESGLAGHFDPVVVISVLLSYLFLIRGKPIISGLFLGAGFSLKLYPIFLLPVFLLGFRKWKDRGILLAGFVSVFLISSLPILIRDPVLLLDYFVYQTAGWYSGLSVRFLMELILDIAGFPTSAAAVILNLALAAGALYLYYRGATGKIKRKDLSLIAVLTSLLIIIMLIYGISIIKAGSHSIYEWTSGMFSLGRSILFIGLSVYLFVSFDSEGGENGIQEGTKMLKRHIPVILIPTVSASVLILLLICSPQFHPWYLLWIFPFALASDPPLTWISVFLFGFLQTSAYPPWEVGGF